MDTSTFHVDMGVEFDFETPPRMELNIDPDTPSVGVDLGMNLDLAQFFLDDEDHDFLVRNSDQLILMLDADQVGHLFGSPVLPSAPVVPVEGADESEAGSQCRDPLGIHNNNVKAKVKDTPCGKLEKLTNPGKENIVPVANRYQPRILRKPEIKECPQFFRQVKTKTNTTSISNGPKTVSELVLGTNQGQSDLSFITPVGTNQPYNRGFDSESTLTSSPAVKRSRANEEPPTFLETPKSSTGNTGKQHLMPRRLFSRIRI